LFRHDHLAWKTDEKEGAYAGQSLYDHNQDGFITNKGDSYELAAGEPSRAEAQGMERAGIRPGSARATAYSVAQRNTQPW